MPVTTLDTNTALIVVDLQNGIVNMPTATPIADVVENAAKLAHAFRSRGPGVATSAGVESTARHAHENGYHVTLATDAMTDRRIDTHLNSITRIFPRIGETGTTTEILALLDQRG
jgi:nicotinamidase-related amidase